MKKIIYVLSIIALGIVIFNNLAQSTILLKENINYILGLFLGLSSALIYGIVNIK